MQGGIDSIEVQNQRYTLLKYKVKNNCNYLNYVLKLKKENKNYENHCSFWLKWFRKNLCLKQAS